MILKKTPIKPFWYELTVKNKILMQRVKTYFRLVLSNSFNAVAEPLLSVIYVTIWQDG